MKTLIVSHAALPINRPSGLTSLLREILREMARRGLDVTVLSVKKLGEQSIYKYQGTKIYKFLPLNFVQYLQLINKINPDRVIFFSNISSGILPVLWWFVMRILIYKRQVFLYQTTNFRHLSKNKLILKSFFKSFKEVYCGSEIIKSDIKKISGVNGKILLPGVDQTELLQKLKKCDFSGSVIEKIGFFGHLSYIKGADVFIDLSKRLPGYKFLLVAGKSKSKSDIALEEKFMSEKQQLTNLVYFGFVENPLDLIASCDLIILPYREGGSILGVTLSAIEAMGMGIPVIGTKNSALDSIIKDGVNGYFCKNSDEMIEKIQLLERDRSLYKKLSQNAQQTVYKKFNIVNLVNTLENTLRNE